MQSPPNQRIKTRIWLATSCFVYHVAISCYLIYSTAIETAQTFLISEALSLFYAHMMLTLVGSLGRTPLTAPNRRFYTGQAKVEKAGIVFWCVLVGPGQAYQHSQITRHWNWGLHFIQRYSKGMFLKGWVLWCFWVVLLLPLLHSKELLCNT